MSLKLGCLKHRETRQLGEGKWDLGSDPPVRRDLSSDQAYLCKGEGGSSGPRRPPCGAGSSQHAVSAEILCPGPHPDPPSAPPALLLGFFSSLVASFSPAPNLPRDPRVLAPLSPSSSMTQESAPPLLVGIMNLDTPSSFLPQRPRSPGL